MIKKQKSKSYVNRPAKGNAFDREMKKLEKKRFYELMVGIALLVALSIFTVYFVLYFDKVSRL